MTSELVKDLPLHAAEHHTFMDTTYSESRIKPGGYKLCTDAGTSLTELTRKVG